MHALLVSITTDRILSDLGKFSVPFKVKEPPVTVECDFHASQVTIHLVFNLSDLSFQAAQRVMSSDPQRALRVLRDISQNLPMQTRFVKDIFFNSLSPVSFPFVSFRFISSPFISFHFISFHTKLRCMFP